jgi:two-component system, OmpR family, response regulator QseB
MRILIVEDDLRIATPVADDLRRQRHVVDVATDGRRGFEFAQTGIYDLILLDIMLPGTDGLSLCRGLRSAGEQAMILMITARDGVAEKVAALDAGADDYVVKPFDLAELSARVRAVGRRTRDARPPLMRHGDLVLDPGGARVTFQERLVSLTATEYAILETLMRHSQQIFTRAMLQDKVTTLEGGTSESIKMHIGNLRRKLRAAGCDRDPITTIYGTGYRLSDL